MKIMSVRGRDRLALQADPGFVYVGRGMWRQGWPESPFRNPYRVGQWDNPVRLFRLSLLAAIRGDELPREALDLSCRDRAAFAEMARRLPELRGKTLGCWCVDWDGSGPIPRECHAGVLVAMVKEVNS